MKSISGFLFIVFSSLFIIFYTQNIQGSGNNPIDNDSLLFDGSGTSSFFNEGPCGCTLKIIRQAGLVYGAFCEMKIGDVCGLKDTITKIFKGIIPSYATEILDVDSIRTGDFADSEIDLQLNDGKRIHMSRNTSVTISKDHCKNPMSLVLHRGLLYLDLTGGDKNKTISIKTERGEVVNRGTRFTTELVQNGGVTSEVVRVYEGSVTYSPNTSNPAYTKDAKDKGEEIKKLNADFQAGKITAQEFADKLKELTSNYKAPEVKTVTVEAGYESTITGNGNPSDPVQFDVSNDPGPIK